jgi:hypothetical protein
MPPGGGVSPVSIRIRNLKGRGVDSSGAEFFDKPRTWIREERRICRVRLESIVLRTIPSHLGEPVMVRKTSWFKAKSLCELGFVAEQDSLCGLVQNGHRIC